MVGTGYTLMPNEPHASSSEQSQPSRCLLAAEAAALTTAKETTVAGTGELYPAVLAKVRSRRNSAVFATTPGRRATVRARRTASTVTCIDVVFPRPTTSCGTSVTTARTTGTSVPSVGPRSTSARGCVGVFVIAGFVTGITIVRIWTTRSGTVRARAARVPSG